jgi:hypothetical protein
MSIKLALLKSGEQVISTVKELSSNDEFKAYVFCNPHKVTVQKQMLLTEEEILNDSVNREYQVMLSPWILLSQDEDIIVNPDWVVSIVEPVASLKEIYMEKIGV